MEMRAVVGLSCLALALAAGAQATPARGTLAGVVMRGPITPVCAVEQPCSAPAKDVTLLFTRDERILGRTTTDAQGRYRVRLPAGSYLVHRPGPTTVGRRLAPSRVRVIAGRLRDIDFFIDTGIR